jgi:hypothetical protein
MILTFCVNVSQKFRFLAREKALKESSEGWDDQVSITDLAAQVRAAKSKKRGDGADKGSSDADEEPGHGSKRSRHELPIQNQYNSTFDIIKPAIIAAAGILHMRLVPEEKAVRRKFITLVATNPVEWSACVICVCFACVCVCLVRMLCPSCTFCIRV